MSYTPALCGFNDLTDCCEYSSLLVDRLPSTLALSAKIIKKPWIFSILFYFAIFITLNYATFRCRVMSNFKMFNDKIAWFINKSIHLLNKKQFCTYNNIK